MSARPVLAVARWEYQRFAKPRDLIMSIVSFMVIFGIFGIVGQLVDRKSNEEKTVAVLGGEFMGLMGVEAFDRFKLLAGERDRDTLEAALLDEEFNALLVVEGPAEAELIIRGERRWQQEFLGLLVGHIQSRRLLEGGLDPEVLAALTAVPELQRLELERPAGSAGRAETKTALIVVGIMLMGLFVGFSYVFVAITGEKSQRVTESVLSAITPQQWMDGKILGLTAVVILNLISYGVGYLLYKLAAVILFDAAFSLPSGIGDASTVAWLILYSLLGFGFWFTLLAMLAATINDPNSSSRSSFILLPSCPWV